MHDLDHEVGDHVEQRRLPGYLGVVAVDPDGIIRHVSTELDGRFGLGRDDVLGRQFLDFVSGDDVEQSVESFVGVVARSGHHQALQVGIRGSDGSIRAADVVAENCLADPTLGLIILNLAAADDRLRSVQLLDAQAHVVRQLALGATPGETVGAVLEFLEGVLPGYRAAAYLDDDLLQGRATAAPSISPAFTQRMATAIRSNPAMPGAMAAVGNETIVAGDLDDARWNDARAAVAGLFGAIWSTPICHDRGGERFGLIEIYGPHAGHPRDEDWVALTLASRLAAAGCERLRLQQSLVSAAEIDPLTSAPNRRVIKSTLASIIDGDERGHPVCFVDLDRLKVVNDSLGHEAGDDLIREAARRLIAGVGSLGTVGRFGGDEFVAIASSAHVSHEDLAERCRRAFDEPVSVGGRRWRVTASIGVVRVGSHRSSGDVLRDADAAMYEAKRSGRNRWHVFDDATRDSVVRRMQLEELLSRAVERDKIDAHFQPIVGCRDWTLHGLETLARWPRTADSWVEPSEFIPLAEELGYIEQVGAKMLTQAIEMADVTASAGLGTCAIAINVSPLQLQSTDLFERLRSLAAQGRRIDRLCLEMTEQHMIDDSEQTLLALDRLLGLGVGLAVDDFGTGYSSLGSLHRLPAHTLKIDRRLVEQVTVPTGRSVVVAVVGVAKAFSMTTVAEGVETVEQARALRELGVDALQGYAFAPAASMADTLERLRRPWPWITPRDELDV